MRTVFIAATLVLFALTAQAQLSNDDCLSCHDTIDGKKFTDQISLGEYLVSAYHLRSVLDITSCNTCHR